MNVPSSYFYHDNIQKKDAFNNSISSNEKEEFWDDVSQSSNKKKITPKKDNNQDNILALIGNFNTPNFICQSDSVTKNSKSKSNKYSENMKKEADYLTFKNSPYNPKIPNNNPFSITIEKNKKAEQDTPKTNIINNIRLSKFQNFLKKYDNNKGKKNKSRSVERKKRIDVLYEQAKIKNIYIERIQNQNKNMKIKKEIENCTFNPRINKKSKLIFSTSKLNQSSDIYERNLDWEMQKNEKLQMEKKKKNDSKINFTYQPILNKNHLTNVFNNNYSVKNNLSTVLFLERQERARENKQYRTNNSRYSSHYKTKYRSCSTDTSRLCKHINNAWMNQCKAVLHDELLTEELDTLE